MLTIFIRTIILYLLVLIVMRLMGKREIGQLQPFELAIAILIADLASIPMSDMGIPIMNGVVPIFALLIMHLGISLLNLKSIRARQIICGKPSILIYKGQIDEEILKKERFTVNELQERLRGNNVSSLLDVDYAILETSGQLTVIKKPEKQNVIVSDLQISRDYEGIPYDLIIDGTIMDKNLEEIKKDVNWLEKEIKKKGLTINNVLLATYDGAGNMYVQEKNGGKK